MKIEDIDPTNLTQRECSLAELKIKEIFEPILPYKAKNGIYFKLNGISIITQQGIVFGSNGLLSDNKFYLILDHHPKYDDRASFIASCKVTKNLENTLEALSRAIIDASNKFKKSLL